MRNLRGWTRPRPIRIAFLVQDGEHAATLLDGVFADCYARWGGRFSLVVPCVEARIPGSYWPWLECYDPDLIYSYVTLSEADTIEIHERLGPSQIYFHRLGLQPRLDVFGFKPDYGAFSPLSSLSAVFRLARYRRGEDLPLRIVDSWHTEQPSRFLTDNFGTYGQSQATGHYPADATTAADRIIIVDPDHAADQRLGVPRDLTMVPNELEAFRAIGDGRAACMATLSASLAPKLEIHSGRWSSSFNLVVGDSFADRLLSWNARLLIPDWLDANICSLRIAPDQLDDPDFLATLVNLLNRYNHVNGGSGGQPQLTVRSCSLDGTQLAALAERLRAAKLWSAVSTEVIGTPDAVIPDGNALAAAREGNRFTGEFFPTPGWTAFDWLAPTVRPPVDAPDHLTDAPIRQTFTIGHWASDFVLEHDGPGSRMGENRWMLPRRWRLAGAFKIELVSPFPQVTVPPARASREGRLTTFVSSGHPIALITVPTPRSVVEYALALDGLHANVASAHGKIVQPPKVAWLRAGNEDRYLTGVLGMTDGLEWAANFLLHPFLRGVFAQLGGNPNPSDRNTEWTDNRLKKLVGRQEPYDLRNEGDRQALSTLIVRAARELKNPKAFTSYAKLKETWTAHCVAYRTANPRPEEGTPQDGEFRDAEEKKSLCDCLIALRRRKMLFQGHRWICGRCSHHNWQNFGDLSAELACEVCKQVRQAPVEIEWLFRPNEFLIECLRDHSTLSLIWLLDTLTQRARLSFLYAGPTEFGFSAHAEASDAESDLLAIVDGKVLLCEAKSSWRDVRQAELDKLGDLAVRLRPDMAVLAVMEAGAGPADKISELMERLRAAKIGFEVLTPRPAGEYDIPFLPDD